MICKTCKEYNWEMTLNFNAPEHVMQWICDLALLPTKEDTCIKYERKISTN